jgi:hypothetical protein
MAMLLATIAALCAVAAIANPGNDIVSGVVVSHDASGVVIETTEGRRTFLLGADVTFPADVTAGDIVVVSLTEPGSSEAEKVVAVDEQVVVVGEAEAERAVIGTVTAISPQQLLVETTTGGQAFVISPEKLFPPLPEPEQRVAVTYRTLEVHPPQHMATGLVVLPDDVQIAAMRARITSTPTELAETQTETFEQTEDLAAQPAEPADTTEIATLPEQEPLTEQDPLAEPETVTAEADTSVTDPATESTTTSEVTAPETQTASASTWPAQEATTAPQPTEFDETDYDDETAAATLPQTASALPVLLLVGTLAIALLFVARFVR